MKKAVFVSLVLVGSSALASVGDFIGSYTLVQGAQCAAGLNIQSDESDSQYIQVRSSDGYLEFKGGGAVVNGEKEAVTGSDGGGMSSSKGNIKATYIDDVLTFKYGGIEYGMGIPLERTAEITSYSLSDAGKTLTEVYQVYKGAAAIPGIFKKTYEKTCVFERD